MRLSSWGVNLTRPNSGRRVNRPWQQLHDALVDASRSTVQVLASGRVVAFGTVVGQGGFILTKASQLKGDFRCGESLNVPAHLHPAS